MARLCAASDDDQNWVALGDKYTLNSVLYAVLQTLHCIMNSYNPTPPPSQALSTHLAEHPMASKGGSEW